MKKILATILFSLALQATLFSQTDLKDSVAVYIDTTQVIIPIKIGIDSIAAVSDTSSTLIVAENQEAFLAYNDGVELFRNGDFQTAAYKFTIAIQFNPSFEKAYFNRGSSYLQQQELDLAYNDFDSCRILYPDKASVYYYLGYISFYQQKPEKAEEYFNTAIAKGFINANLYYLKGILEFNKNNFTAAIENFDNSIANDEKNFLAYHDRGSAYRMTGKPDAG